MEGPPNVQEPERRFPDDYAFAQKLIDGDENAWREHSRRWNAKSAAYIERRYPGVFNDADKKDILQNMGLRLLENDKKCLRVYEGMQSLSRRIEQQLEWAILDELRKRAIDFLAEDEYDDEENNEADGSGLPDSVTGEGAGEIDPGAGNIEPEIPACLMELPDEQRWVYLLRYYEDFGFPEREVALLAQKRNMSADELSKLINGLLEPTGEDILASKREDLNDANERIERYRTKLYLLSLEEQKLEEDITGEIMGGVDARSVKDRLREIGDDEAKMRQRVERAIAERGEPVIETPYEVIRQIIGEDNLNTLRGRLLSARKKLAKKLISGNREQKPKKRRLNR